VEALEEVADSIQVRHIETPAAELFSTAPDLSSADVGRVMLERGFTQAPVVDGAGISGFVLRRDLIESDEAVGLRTRGLGQDVLVSADTPLGGLLPLLAQVRFREPAFYFVLEGHVVTGLVTRSDLNKESARAYFFVRLASLERSFNERVRRAYPDDGYLGFLGADQREKIRRRHRQASSLDLDVPMACYLDFPDLLKIVGRTPEIRMDLGVTNEEVWLTTTQQFDELRNRVSHAPRDILDSKLGIEQLVDIDRRLTALAARAG